jgi:hypothetical protein
MARAAGKREECCLTASIARQPPETAQEFLVEVWIVRQALDPLRALLVLRAQQRT